VRILKNIFSSSPISARVLPFLIFVALTVCQGKFGNTSIYWFYLAKTIVGAWLIWEIRPFVSEMRWAFSWEALVVGVGIFAVWVGLDSFYPHFTKNNSGWNPDEQFGAGSAMAWSFILIRIFGSTFIVPPLEEVFYRSFLYRYIANQNFLAVPFNCFLQLPFFVTAIFFGLSHNEWLAGILCGMAFQWLVLRKNRLGDAMTAHAITNFLLGVWIVWKHDWHFW